MKTNFDLYQNEIIKTITPALSFDPNCDLNEYKKVLREKLIELLGIKNIEKNACELQVDIDSTTETEKYIIIRFTVETEKYNYVPCILVVPNTGKDKYDLVITIHGHSDGGVRLLVNEAEPAELNIPGHKDMAFQAADNGYAALGIEMRGRDLQFTKIPYRSTRPNNLCQFPAFTALLMGRCHIGERVWDISRVLDIMPMFKNINLDNIVMTGPSGGGTMTFYSSAYDERIKFCVPVVSFCPYAESILDKYHCICNYIPGAYQWFDMQDICALIAPRVLCMVNGEKDFIFPIDGARRGFKVAEQIYEKAGVRENLSMVVTPYPHQWAADYVWPAINKLKNK